MSASYDDDDHNCYYARAIQMRLEQASPPGSPSPGSPPSSRFCRLHGCPLRPQSGRPTYPTQALPSACPQASCPSTSAHRRTRLIDKVPIWSFTTWLLKRQLLPARKAINLQTSWATAGLGIAVSGRGSSREQIRLWSAIYCTF